MAHPSRFFPSFSSQFSYFPDGFSNSWKKELKKRLLSLSVGMSLKLQSPSNAKYRKILSSRVKEDILRVNRVTLGHVTVKLKVNAKAEWISRDRLWI